MPFPGLCGLLKPLIVLETTSGTAGPLATCYRAILALVRLCGNLFCIFWKRQANGCSALCSTASRDLRLTYTGDIR